MSLQAVSVAPSSTLKRKSWLTLGSLISLVLVFLPFFFTAVPLWLPGDTSGDFSPAGSAL
ncbi:MAG TPA: hypothetical protein DIU35_03250 [Candidatus Latescibacteria bacterium]|nr:hypothetical protein [Gemmatimonadota bacterium]HCR16476.1 hypothetical protein [Candidatus Latescibacterota bacterium]